MTNPPGLPFSCGACAAPTKSLIVSRGIDLCCACWEAELASWRLLCDELIEAQRSKDPARERVLLGALRSEAGGRIGRMPRRSR